MRAARLLAVPVVVAVLVAAPPAAEALITGGSLGVGLPNGSFPAFFDVDTGVPPAQNQVTLSGAVVNDGPGWPLTAKVGCYTVPPGLGGGQVDVGNVADVTLNPADGTFNEPVYGPTISSTACIMGLATALGPSPGTSFFGNLLYTVIQRRITRVTGGPNGGAIKGLTISSAGTQGNSTIGDPDSGAPLALGPVESGPSPRTHSWNMGGAILDAASLPGTRSSITVDGKNAYTSGEEAQIDDTIPGLQGLKIDRFVHAGNSVSVTMVEPFLTCPGSPCTAYKDAGIALRRTAETNSTNRNMTVTDEWVSTDGKPHALDILLQYEIGGPSPEISLPWVADGAFKAPGGVVPAPTGTVNTLVVHTNAADTGDTQGSVTLSARPVAMKYTGVGDFQLQFQRTAPATGASRIVSTYTSSTGGPDGAAIASAESAARADAPRVTITSPASSAAPAYTATGTAASPAGVASVVVNGTPAAVASDGSWSAPLTLNAGANAVTAVLTDGDGATDTASTTVTYTPSVGAAVAAAAAKVAFGKKPSFTKGVLVVNVGCQGQPGQACALTALLTAPPAAKAAARRTPKTVTLLRKTLSIPVGAARPVKLKLSKSALKRIPKRGGLKAQLALTQGTGTAAATQRYRLTLKR